MEKAFAKIEELTETIKDYADTRIELVKLDVAEKLSSVLANLLAGILITTVFLFAVIFAGIALAFALGEWTGKIWAGFLIVSGLYLLIGIVLWTARESIIRQPVINALIKQLFSNEDEED